MITLPFRLNLLLPVFCLLLFTLDTVEAIEAFFEDVIALEMPKREAGYRGMMGDVVELNDGRLLLGFSSFGRPPDVPRGTIGGIISKDQGQTWGTPFTIVDRPQPPGEHHYAHPSFLRLKDGTLLMAYLYIGATEPRSASTYYRLSMDEGKTWTHQLAVTPSQGVHNVFNDKLVRLSTGRIIAPFEHELREEGGDHHGFVSGVCYSDDDGKSWWRSTNLVNTLPVEAQEPHVVELEDGRLMMLCRTYSGYVVRSYSKDMGLTWSPGEHRRDLKLSINASALLVERIPSTGDLVLLRCTGGERGKYRRTPFVSAISKDEGETWTHEKVIAGDPDDDYGYPSLTFLDDMALISYHQRNGIHVARLSISWFTSGPRSK